YPKDGGAKSRRFFCTMRIALGLEYDGAPFHGWQSQADGSGVQDALERALAVIAGARAYAVAAGRTDAGVHASLQVAHFDTDAARPDTAWVRGVNALLPESIAVRWALVVGPEFRARGQRDPFRPSCRRFSAAHGAQHRGRAGVRRQRSAGSGVDRRAPAKP